jgi:small subunit ribosomal protein S8e
MTVWHGEMGRKKTGGAINQHRKKRKYELGSQPVHTKIGKTKIKLHRMKSGSIKIKAAAVEFANVLDPHTKQIKKVKIEGVIENPANPHYVRRSVITKGSIIKTELGNARITSRPSQHGIVNAVILEKEKS